MIGKKFFIYTPETNLNIAKDGYLLNNGEVRYSFSHKNNAYNFINAFDEDFPFVLVEKNLFTQDIIDLRLSKISHFENEKQYQSNKEISFKKVGNGTPPNVKYRWSGTLVSENFKDFTSYFYMKTLLPVLEEQYYCSLLEMGYKVKRFNLNIVAKTYGWFYKLDLDIVMNPFIASTLTPQDVFKNLPEYEDVLTIRNSIVQEFNEEDYFSYYNVASDFSLKPHGEKYSYENYERMKEFYSSCLSKDWEIL